MRFMQTVRNYLAKQNELADASGVEVEENGLSSQPIARVMACLDGWLMREGGCQASCCMLCLFLGVLIYSPRS